MIGPGDDFSAVLRACRDTVQPFAVGPLSEFFGLPDMHFHQGGAGAPIVFHPGACDDSAALLLRGTLFWPSSNEQQIVRSHPRIFPTSDYCGARHQILLEPLLAAAADSGELIAEPKVYGETVRVFSRGRDLYCATDVAHDGGNPLVGAGIDNAGALGVDYGSQAARLLAQHYPRTERLARLGYTAVFVLQLPDLAPDHSVDRADLVLVDVIDPDCSFVDRLEKERIADDYKLTVVDLAARITLPTAEPAPLLKRCRAFEHNGGTTGSAGTIVKGRLSESGDQMFCKVEPSSERERSPSITPGDLSAVADEVTGQFGDKVWQESRFAEELMLEYLGSHHRSVRRQVNNYLGDWRAARKLAGLP